MLIIENINAIHNESVWDILYQNNGSTITLEIYPIKRPVNELVMLSNNEFFFVCILIEVKYIRDLLIQYMV